MATLTFFLKDVSVSGFGSLSLTDPGATTMNTGWVSAKTAAGNFSALLYGTERATATFSTTDYLVTTHPNPGGGDSWRSESGIRGVFANANWTLTFRVRAITSASTQLGRVKVRIWKSSNPAGTSATELTSATLTGTTTGAITTSADATSTVTWSPGATQTFNGEYLFVQCEWEITTAGGTTSADVDFRASASTVLTSDFTPAPHLGNTRLSEEPLLGPYFDVQFRTWLQAPQLQAPPTPPPTDIDTVRAPHFSPPRKPESFPYDIPPNLLGTTLGPVRLPNNQFDWPLPKSVYYHINLRSWAGVQQPPAPLAAELPIGAAALDLPPKGYEFNIALRSWVVSPRPVEVVIVVDTSVPRAPVFTRPREPAPLLSTQPLRPLTLFAAPIQIPFNQNYWPLTSAQRQPAISWTASYNINLIGQDKFPTGEIRTELARGYEHHVQLRTWAWNYNLNLIGKDIVPGESITDRPAIAPRLLQTWINAVNLNLTAAPAAPFSQSDWQLPVTWRQPQRSWTASYNLNLIGQDKLPSGKIITDRPTLAAIRVTDLSTWIDQTKLLLAVPFGQSDWPLPRAPLLPQRSWAWSYNLNLIGKDALPSGEIISGLPPQPPLTAIQLRTWINSAALALITVPPAKPFAQYDWPLNFGPLQPVTIFTATYNKNLIGKDIVPGKIVSDLPPRAPQQPAQSFTGKYNENLIGKDKLPTGAEITDLPPRQALRPENLRTWIQSVNLALTTQAAVLPNNQSDWPITLPPRPQARTFIGFYNLNLIGKDSLPINQSDWPLPRAPLVPQRSWTASYNLNLIGKDQLPVGEINTSLPAQQRLALQTWINAVNLALTSVTALPFNQSNWPINTGPRQPDRSYGHVFSRVLIGQDRLPFRQQDWPIWRDHLRAPPSFTAFYNRNLIGKDRLPFRQQDWPLPRDPRRLAAWINLTDPNLFIPGPAPPPPRSPSHRDVSLAIEATRFGEGEQVRPDDQQSRRPAAPQSTRSNVQDPGIRR